MSDHAVESVHHLTDTGVKAAEKTARVEPAIKELDASKLTITRTTNPGTVPELNSKEVWDMKTSTDHSEFIPKLNAVSMLSHSSAEVQRAAMASPPLSSSTTKNHANTFQW